MVPVAVEEAESSNFSQNLTDKPSPCFGFSPSLLIKAWASPESPQSSCWGSSTLKSEQEDLECCSLSQSARGAFLSSCVPVVSFHPCASLCTPPTLFPAALVVPAPSAGLSSAPVSSQICGWCEVMMQRSAPEHVHVFCFSCLYFAGPSPHQVTHSFFMSGIGGLGPNMQETRLDGRNVNDK